jgi:hypothetical protein
MTHHPVFRQRAKNGFILGCIALLAMLLLSACGVDPQTQQNTNSSKAQLDTQIAHARNIGVPNSMLQPIIQQENQLSKTNAPLPLFFDAQDGTNYYNNLTQRYRTLTLQVQGMETQATQQLDYQASENIQSLENMLATRQSQNFIEAKTFQKQLEQDQNRLAKAQYPKDYIQIGMSALKSTLALNLMGPAYNDLTTFQQDVKQLQSSHVDTTAYAQEEQQDLQAFRTAAQPDDFSNLINLLQTQIQTTSDVSTQAIPYVGAAKLQQFSQDIAQLKQYGQSTSTYQQKLTADQTALNNAKTISDYLNVSAQIDKDIASLQIAMTVGNANYLYNQYEQEVTNWGNAHMFHDAVDGNNYPLDYEYGQYGVGLDGGAAIQYAQSTGQLSDYQAAISIIQNNFMDLRAMESDYNDKTPYNQPHATDFQLMQHYGVYGPNSGAVLVVSFAEQTLRYYVNDKLVRAFYIVSGQYEKPSPPGFWSIILKESPTVFKSSEPPGSAFWYPNTNIKYAMEYHSDGYFFHDAWWRASFGPGDEFPHNDASGTTSFNGNGSHGCINMASSDVAWLYPQIPYGTPVILY